jgi:hypothetical protein
MISVRVNSMKQDLVILLAAVQTIRIAVDSPIARRADR